jgi:HD-like signal output (HDOD) protein
MFETRKTRIPSVPYLVRKIAQIREMANPQPDDIVLLDQYKKNIESKHERR